MGEHASWFDYLFPLHAWEESVSERFGFHVPFGALCGGLFVTVLIVLGALVVRRTIRDPQKAIVPDPELSLRTLFELIVDGAYGVMKGIMTPGAARYFLPLIATAALYILFSNLLGLVPGFLPPTSNLSMTAALGCTIFFATHIYGFREHGLGYLLEFVGPIHKWYALPLMALMFIVEMVSHIVRPVSLSLRLMANMFADHAVVGSFYQLQAWIVPIPVMMLGILVCIVQTLVFCILSTIYISMAISHGEH